MRSYNRKWKNQPRRYPLAQWAWRILCLIALYWAVDTGCDRWAEVGEVASTPVEVER